MHRPLRRSQDVVVDGAEELLAPGEFAVKVARGDAGPGTAAVARLPRGLGGLCRRYGYPPNVHLGYAADFTYATT